MSHDLAGTSQEQQDPEFRSGDLFEAEDREIDHDNLSLLNDNINAENPVIPAAYIRAFGYFDTDDGIGDHNINKISVAVASEDIETAIVSSRNTVSLLDEVLGDEDEPADDDEVISRFRASQETQKVVNDLVFSVGLGDEMAGSLGRLRNRALDEKGQFKGDARMLLEVVRNNYQAINNLQVIKAYVFNDQFPEYAIDIDAALDGVEGKIAEFEMPSTRINGMSWVELRALPPSEARNAVLDDQGTYGPEALQEVIDVESFVEAFGFHPTLEELQLVVDPTKLDELSDIEAKIIYRDLNLSEQKLGAIARASVESLGEFFVADEDQALNRLVFITPQVISNDVESIVKRLNPENRQLAANELAMRIQFLAPALGPYIRAQKAEFLQKRADIAKDPKRRRPAKPPETIKDSWASNIEDLTGYQIN